MEQGFDLKTIIFDVQKRTYQDVDTSEIVDFKKLISEGWYISGQSSLGNKIVYTLVKSKILLE